MVYSRFAIKTIDQELTATGYIIVVTTDHRCHLWMRWTLQQPWRHIDTKVERGVALDKDIRICFVAFHDNEQEEEGDTYEHTFIKEPWAHCETRYFYFLGQVSASLSPSTSAIFTKHRIKPPYALILLEPWTVTYEPPDFTRIILEPWTATYGPPDFERRIFEPWTS